MTRPTITRRGLVPAGTAAPRPTVLPNRIVQPMSVAVPSEVAAFDAAGFVADLRASGFAIDLWRSCVVDDGSDGPSYGVRRVGGGGLGDSYRALLDRWSPAMGSTPDHRDRVLDVLEAERAAASAGAWT